jgi:DNA-binding MarR family transcriptional regulator
MQKLALEDLLPYHLARVGVSRSQEFRKVYGPDYDLTIPEWRVLATLGQFEEMGAKAIGAHSSMHKTKVSRAVRALEERRWLKRRTSDDDRREEVLNLTPLGRKAYGDVVPRALTFEAKVKDALGPDADAFMRGLAALETKLSSHR